MLARVLLAIVLLAVSSPVFPFGGPGPRVHAQALANPTATPRASPPTATPAEPAVAPEPTVASHVEEQAQDYSEVLHGDPATGLVALTFDAGAEAGSAAPEVLEILRERGIHATFFLSGRWVEKYPDLAQQVVADGHEIANHSYTHPDLTQLSDNQVVFELDYTDQVVSDITGAHTRPYFRPPFGARNRRVLDVAAAAGFRSIYWSLDSGDWLARATSAAVVDRVLRFSEPGDIVVEHVASDATAGALPIILDAFSERGWRVGTVSQVLELPSDTPPPSDPASRPRAPDPSQPSPSRSPSPNPLP